MAIHFGNDKIKEIYVGSDIIKEVYYGSELVWSGGLILFKSNKVNAGFELFRRVGPSSGTAYYIGNDKIELSYNYPNTAIAVGLTNSIDFTQFSNLLIEYVVTPISNSSKFTHRIGVSSGVTAVKTTTTNRKYNLKEYIPDEDMTNIYDSMLIDLSNFEVTQGTVNMKSCYPYVQLQPNNSSVSGEAAKLEITKIELK